MTRKTLVTIALVLAAFLAALATLASHRLREQPVPAAKP